MRLIEQLYRLLAPANCLACGSEGRLICAWCIETALPEAESRCYKCNTLTQNSATCQPCRRKTPVRHLYNRTVYSDTARNLVHAMKFKYSGEAADIIAVELSNKIPALHPETLIVHVPTITSHVRQRGFDHSGRIARKLAEAANLDYYPALARTGQQRQVGSSRRLRLSQMTGVYRVRNQEMIKGARILLVDDVFTTGATIESAAEALKHAGAKSIDAVVFAHGR